MKRFWIGLCALAATPALAAKPVRTQLPGTAEPVAYDLAITPDARALTFAARVSITVEAPRPTSVIVLNAADLAISRATLDGAPAAGVGLDAAAQTAIITFARPLAAGRHVLSLDYTGKINSRPAALFKIDYDTAAGKGAGRMLATQFEPADARRFLPSFDEPAKKATFTVTAVVPAAQTAVSNMPEVASEPLPGGLKRVRFAPTPKMSSYLLFFGAGDLERITADVDGTTVGVVVRRGDTDKGRFALGAASELLRYYNGYFGTRYPLPKLDLIAAPGDTGGAMENWGAIQYQQSYLLIDPARSTDADRQEVFSVVAHEMAHQWFGDLVTMAWWNDLWLNEAFASWMATKASDHFHPEWKPLLRALGDKDDAMRLDARSSTHPIVREIATVAQAEQAFDAITYKKGEAVLRMLEAYAGEDAWRAGVRRYMARYAYRNTLGDDLWAEMDAAAKRPISEVANDFTRQPGVPLIQARLSGMERSLRQARFGVDRQSRTSTSWRVPVAVANTSGGLDWRGLVSAAQLHHTLALVEPSDKQRPSHVDSSVGYFRTLYAPGDFTGLLERFATLPASEQISLLNDELALGYSGDQPMGDVLSTVAALPLTADPVVWEVAVRQMLSVYGAYPHDSRRHTYGAWATARVRPLLARLGFDAAPGEGANSGVLRQSVLGALAEMGEPSVVAEGRRRFEAFRRDPSSLSAASHGWVLEAVARNADVPTWEALHALARASRDPLEKQRLYEALAGVQDPALAARVLELSLTAEPPANLGPRLIGDVAEGHPDLAWRFVLAHETELGRSLDALARTTFVPRIAAASTDPRRADELLTYAEKNIPADARGEVNVAIARIRQSADIASKRLPEVDAWIARR